MRLLSLKSRSAKPLMMVLSLMLLAGCATTTTATNSKAVCAPWRAIDYSSKNDTPETVNKVRVHNLTGSRLGCWR